MPLITISAQVEAVVGSLSQSDFEDFEQICEHISKFLPALINADLVTYSALFGVESYRYYDHRFPYLIRFRRFLDQQTEFESLYIFLMARADPYNR